MKHKITFIGGGSYQWVPTLFRDIAVNPSLQDTTFVLHDIDAERNAELTEVCQIIKRKTGAKLEVSAEDHLDRALSGASAVVLCISTGGLDAMAHDLDIPLRYGIRQSVGDSTGPGGISRTLRNVPVVTRIARQMEEHCPDAWLLNLSNPMCQIVRAIDRSSSIKVVGLCHEYMGFMAKLENLFGLQDWRQEVSATIAGVNHFAWITRLRINGEDGLEMLRARMPELRNLRSLDPGKNSLSNGSDAFSGDRVKLWLFDRYGYMPYPGDRHIAEFFPYFISEKTGFGLDFDVLLTSIEDRRGPWLKKFKGIIEKWCSDKPDSVPLKASHEQLAPILASLLGGPPTIQPIVMPNSGQIDNLPRGATVETMATIECDAITPHASGSLPEPILALTHKHVVNQELTVQGALRGDRASVLQAMLGDPLNNNNDPREIQEMLDALLEANRSLLPQFYPSLPAGRRLAATHA